MNIRLPRGITDHSRDDALLREQISKVLRDKFRLYGYDPIETPIIELKQVLGYMGGGEIQKEVFRLRDMGDEELALRFDQTVPLARYYAMHKHTLPFKRYVIGPVFRDGPAQVSKGRFRQFTQCDVDVLGIKGMSAEAELLCLARETFGELGLGGLDVKINNKKLLDGILTYSGVPVESRTGVMIILDKADKIGIDGVKDELSKKTVYDDLVMPSQKTCDELVKGKSIDDLSDRIKKEIGERGFDALKLAISNTLPEDVSNVIYRFSTNGGVLVTGEQIDKLMEVLLLQGDNEELLRKIEEKTNSYTAQGIAEIRELLRYCAATEVDFVRVDPCLARGLNYYTGTTIEVFLQDKEILPGAILGGGRFDNMVGQFVGDGIEIPAVGFSFGLERLVHIVKNSKSPKTHTAVYVIPMKGVSTEYGLAVSEALRKQGFNVDMEHLDRKKVGESISYADERGIQYVCIIGDKEVVDGTVTIKNLMTREQKNMPINDVAAFINR